MEVDLEKTEFTEVCKEETKINIEYLNFED